MSIWLTSDTHFGHPLLAAIRGFYNDTEAGRNAQSMHDSGATSSQIIEWAQQSHISMKEIADCDAHDRFVIDSINSCVSPGDELWHLGDVGFRCGIEHIRECMSQISVPVANRHLLIGNHDKCFRGNTKGNPADFDEVYLGMFSTVDEKVLIDNPLDGGKLMLCHFPWLESAGRDGYVRERCLQYYPDRSRYMSHGGQIPLLYGHTHADRFDDMSDLMAFNVGLDAWDMKPVRLETVYGMM